MFPSYLELKKLVRVYFEMTNIFAAIRREKTVDPIY